MQYEAQAWLAAHLADGDEHKRADILAAGAARASARRKSAGTPDVLPCAAGPSSTSRLTGSSASASGGPWTHSRAPSYRKTCSGPCHERRPRPPVEWAEGNLKPPTLVEADALDAVVAALRHPSVPSPTDPPRSPCCPPGASLLFSTERR